MESSRLLKPWLILPPRTLFVVLLVLALAAAGAGGYLTFFATRGFQDAVATIVRIDSERDSGGEKESDAMYTVYVTYTVDGTDYTELLDSYFPNYEVGKQVEVKYDPENPALVRTASVGFGVYLMIVGAALGAGAALVFLKSRQKCGT